eukprot:106549-Hanusia_phi.AAC.2
MMTPPPRSLSQALQPDRRYRRTVPGSGNLRGGEPTETTVVTPATAPPRGPPAHRVRGPAPPIRVTRTADSGCQAESGLSSAGTE